MAKSKTTKTTTKSNTSSKSVRVATDQPQPSKPTPEKRKFFRRRSNKQTGFAKISSGPKLLGQACATLIHHWKVFLGLLAIYGVLNLALVGGLNGGSDLQLIKEALNEVFTGRFAELTTGLALFSFLIGAGNASNTDTESLAGPYQTILLLTVSLAIIWTLRQVYAGYRIRIRDAFYQGMRPLVPFLLVMLVVALEFIPFLIGGALYNAALVAGSAYALEQVIALVFFFLLTAVTLYLLCSSLIALYVVTLPEMTPVRALQSAQEVVRYRRLAVFRKLLFLPVSLLIIAALIMVPIALYATPIAAPVYFVLTIISVAIVHSYMYALYRELIA